MKDRWFYCYVWLTTLTFWYCETIRRMQVPKKMPYVFKLVFFRRVKMFDLCFVFKIWLLLEWVVVWYHHEEDVWSSWSSLLLYFLRLPLPTVSYEQILCTETVLEGCKTWRQQHHWRSPPQQTSCMCGRCPKNISLIVEGFTGCLSPCSMLLTWRRSRMSLKTASCWEQSSSMEMSSRCVQHEVLLYRLVPLEYSTHGIVHSWF